VVSVHTIPAAVGRTDSRESLVTKFRVAMPLLAAAALWFIYSGEAEHGPCPDRSTSKTRGTPV
jgi:hypothetical protein